MFTDLDAIDYLMFGAFAVCVGCILALALIGYVVCRRTPEPDEHNISGMGAHDAARLRGADLSHDAATDQRRGGE